MQVFDAAATRALLPAAALVDAVAQAMRARRDGTLQAPERLSLALPQGGRYLVMPAADAELAVAKLVSVHPQNRARGLPSIHGLVVVSDARDGRLHMVLDGPTVTARRTAAVSILGLRTLRPGRVRAVALLGTGVQAIEHARMLTELGEIEHLHLVGRTPAQAQAMAERLRRLNGATGDAGPSCPAVQIHAQARLEDALDAVQAVITLTSSERPVLPEGLRSDLLVIGVGAFRPQMAELPPGLLRARPVIVDALDGARAEAGDLIQAGLDWQRVTELVDHLDRPVPAVQDAGGLAPVFKTVGQAAWDLAAVRVAWHRLAVDRTNDPASEAFL